MSNRDRRQFSRVPLKRSIALQFDRFDSFVTEVSANISETGMFITAANPQPPGTIFEFLFTLGDDFTLIEGEAEVMWVGKEGTEGDKPIGMGARFRRLDDDSRAVIRRLVERYTADGHAPFDLEKEAPVEELPVSGRSGLGAEEDSPAIDLLRKLVADWPLSTFRIRFAGTIWYRFEGRENMEGALVPQGQVHKLQKLGLVTGYGDSKLWRITEKGREYLSSGEP